MPSPGDLLHRLFEYIGEQLKHIDPRGFRLSSHPGFLRGRGDLAGLPGIDFDIQVEGDHTWLRKGPQVNCRDPIIGWRLVNRA